MTSTAVLQAWGRRRETERTESPWRQVRSDCECPRLSLLILPGLSEADVTTPTFQLGGSGLVGISFSANLPGPSVKGKT